MFNFFKKKKQVEEDAPKYTKYGVSVMRCQPLHMGHIKLIDTMLEKHEMIEIILGSLQESLTSRNPFSHYERKEMLEGHYGKEFGRIKVSYIDDINNPDVWPYYVIGGLLSCYKYNSLSDFTYYTSDDDAAQMFFDVGMEVDTIHREKGISATYIREEIRKGQDAAVKDLLPPNCNFKSIKQRILETECL